MKKLLILAILVGFAALAGAAPIRIRCSSCNGTGFAPNAKGEKGKGTFNCPICRGSGFSIPAAPIGTASRCSSCNGTGFGPNAKGERGKGNFNCPICKGTGRMGSTSAPSATPSRAPLPSAPPRTSPPEPAQTAPAAPTRTPLPSAPARTSPSEPVQTTPPAPTRTPTRCTSCDGTGFGPNAKGEKGRGTFICPICKGTGRN